LHAPASSFLVVSLGSSSREIEPDQIGEVPECAK
jgi:hypothetical protein